MSREVTKSSSWSCWIVLSMKYTSLWKFFGFFLTFSVTCWTIGAEMTGFFAVICFRLYLKCPPLLCLTLRCRLWLFFRAAKLERWRWRWWISWTQHETNEKILLRMQNDRELLRIAEICEGRQSLEMSMAP